MLKMAEVSERPIYFWVGRNTKENLFSIYLVYQNDDQKECDKKHFIEIFSIDGKYQIL